MRRHVKASSEGRGAPGGSLAVHSVLALLAVAVGSLALLASPALARNTNVFSGYLGAASSTPANPYPLLNPTDVAVDNSTGGSARDFYVTDAGNFRVEKFDSTGHFILTFGKGVNQTTGGNICTAASGNSCGGGSATNTPGAFIAPAFVAVDSSSGPSSGDVYVADTGDSKVTKFDSSGNVIASWGTAGQQDGSSVPGGPFTTLGGIAGIAVDPSGNLFVHTLNAFMVRFTEDGSFVKSYSEPRGTAPYGVAVDSADNGYKVTGSPNVEKYDSNGNDLGEVDGLVDGTGLEIDPSNDNLYVDQGAGFITHFTPDCTLNDCTPVDSFGQGSLTSALGLGVDATNHTVYAANAGANNVAVFVAVILPDATTGPPTNPGQTTGTLTGHVDPSTGGNVTNCHFDYGTDTTYSLGSVPCSPATPYSAATDVTADLSGLTPETTYHYRIVATNANGTVTGQDQTYTPHAVAGTSTDPVSNVTAGSATMNGSWVGDGEDTHYYFEWGTTDSYGNTTAAPPGDDGGTATGLQHVSADLVGLAPFTTYHYRIVATNAVGTSFGADVSFSTLGSYEFATTFGSAGSGDGQLNNPQDVAIDNATGDVYVADTGNHRIVEFDAQGNFLAAWGWGVSDGTAAAEVCTSGCQAGLSGNGPGQLTNPTFIEVDNSAGPSAGDVYVADTANAAVQKFDSSGSLLSAWGSGGSINFSAGGQIAGIAVDTAGNLNLMTMNTPIYWWQIGQDGVYQVKYATTGLNTQVPFSGSPSGAGIDISATGLLYELVGPGGGGAVYNAPGTAQKAQSPSVYDGASPNPVNSGITIDRARDDVYIDQGTYIDQFSASAVCGGPPNQPQGCNPSDSFGSGELSGAAGLAINPGSRIVYAANAGDNNVATFKLLHTPDVTTGPASNGGPTSGTVTGHIDPNGPGNVNDCHFEYGTDTSYSLGSVPCTPAAPISAPTDVHADLTGLTPFTTYHYRLVASSADGKGLSAFGADHTFTPGPGLVPAIDEASSGNATSTGVALSAQINPNQSPTIYRFEYGIDTSYGSQTAPSNSIGTDGVDHAVSAQLSGLIPGTLYHYRAIATNLYGTTTSADRVFTTPDAPSVGNTNATGVTDTGATLTASVRPGFDSTRYHFEYGPTAAHGTSTNEGALAADNAVHVASFDISGLAPGATYHFRIVAANSVGTTIGPDQTFTTTAPTPVQTKAPPPPVACKRGYVKKQGKCVKKKQHRKSKHHKRGRRNG